MQRAVNVQPLPKYDALSMPEFFMANIFYELTSRPYCKHKTPMFSPSDFHNGPCQQLLEVNK